MHVFIGHVLATFHHHRVLGRRARSCVALQLHTISICLLPRRLPRLELGDLAVIVPGSMAPLHFNKYLDQLWKYSMAVDCHTHGCQKLPS